MNWKSEISDWEGGISENVLVQFGSSNSYFFNYIWNIDIKDISFSLFSLKMILFHIRNTHTGHTNNFEKNHFFSPKWEVYQNTQFPTNCCSFNESVFPALKKKKSHPALLAILFPSKDNRNLKFLILHQLRMSCLLIAAWYILWPRESGQRLYSDALKTADLLKNNPGSLPFTAAWSSSRFVLHAH